MPVNIGLVFLAGGVLGWVAVLALRPLQHLRGLVVASCSAANFGNLLLIVIPAVCREDGNPFGDDGAACADRGLSNASFSMALGGLYIWTHTYSVMKRSSEIYRATMIDQEAHDPKKDYVRSEEEPWNDDDDEDSAVHEEEHHQSLVMPLLSTSDHQRSVGNNKTNSNSSMWDKLKHGTRQIAEELTAPPIVGAVLGFIVGAVPWLRSTFVGHDAPLRAVQDSLKLLGDGTIPCVTLILGGNLTKGVRRTTVSRWVIAGVVSIKLPLFEPILRNDTTLCFRNKKLPHFFKFFAKNTNHGLRAN